MPFLEPDCDSFTTQGTHPSKFILHRTEKWFLPHSSLNILPLIAFSLNWRIKQIWSFRVGSDLLLFSLLCEYYRYCSDSWRHLAAFLWFDAQDRAEIFPKTHQPLEYSVSSSDWTYCMFIIHCHFGVCKIGNLLNSSLFHQCYLWTKQFE